MGVGSEKESVYVQQSNGFISNSSHIYKDCGVFNLIIEGFISYGSETYYSEKAYIYVNISCNEAPTPTPTPTQFIPSLSNYAFQITNIDWAPFCGYTLDCLKAFKENEATIEKYEYSFGVDLLAFGNIQAVTLYFRLSDKEYPVSGNYEFTISCRNLESSSFPFEAKCRKNGYILIGDSPYKVNPNSNGEYIVHKLSIYPSDGSVNTTDYFYKHEMNEDKSGQVCQEFKINDVQSTYCIDHNLILPKVGIFGTEIN